MKRNFTYYFFIGLLTMIPIGATLWVLNWGLKSFAGPGQKIINKILPGNAVSGSLDYYITWVIGLGLTMLLVIFSGYIISSVFGKFLFAKIEKIISKIPVVNTFYQTIKGITESISRTN